MMKWKKLMQLIEWGAGHMEFGAISCNGLFASIVFSIAYPKFMLYAHIKKDSKDRMNSIQCFDLSHINCEFL
jgi:hypothetical protein